MSGLLGVLLTRLLCTAHALHYVFNQGGHDGNTLHNFSVCEVKGRPTPPRSAKVSKFPMSHIVKVDGESWRMVSLLPCDFPS